MALISAGRRLAALYFFGYVAEASGKALCILRGKKKAPRSHDLIEIIETAGFARLDLPPDLREYAETRSVELRYLMEAEATIDFDEEIRRAQNLSQWLRIRVNRLL